MTASLQVDTLITQESGLLGKPADIGIGRDGTVFILDYGDPSIVQLTRSGDSIAAEWGHAGSGPGELLIPLGLSVQGDTITTTNVGNGRFEVFHRSGQILPSRPAPPEARNARLSLNPDGGYALPANGQDGSLAGLYSRDGTLARRFGTPTVSYTSQFDLGGFRQAALRGEVPDYYRNNAFVALAEDSTVWLTLNTEGVVMRFAPDGKEIGRTIIDDSTFPAIRTRFVQRNAEDSTGRRVYPLSLFADAKPEAGRLWVLLNSPPGQPAVVVRLNHSGSVERRFVLDGVSDVWRMAVRPEDRALLFTSVETATLFQVRMTPEDWGSRLIPGN